MIRCRADVPSMGSHHDSRIAYWDHEPGSPGGETPPSTAGGTLAATEARFMGKVGNRPKGAEWDSPGRTPWESDPNGFPRPERATPRGNRLNQA